MPLNSYNLSGGYDSRVIVHHLDLDLQQGEWLSLVGANGSGKSTFLKLLARILPPITGKVLLDGKEIHCLPPQTVAKRIAILPQQQIIPSGLTVRQLVSLGRTPHQSWYQWDLTKCDRIAVNEALAQTELESYAERPVSQLSGGERQRAFLALALAQNPQVLLLDEPTTYLDIHYQLQLLELLKRLHLEGLTIITVLHEINLAARYSDRIAFMRQGRLYTVGETEEVLTETNIAEVFNVEVMILNTPVGKQICPLTPSLAVR
ncbi:ABC transporter ATP-binding protein [Cyanobacterium aponinum]|uniref:ABC transporter ATP-binding protein n=1 Tax=Cyanobacterium aponinum TaxID=379064 RepID=UPI000C12A51E|nr:ABC transporter ATP-binding protein [Cyanobacterium aponinum]PHV62041.1 iron ABC transporter ATP-binding protein [Cyanobacterium aponinum IPPAS B-1201]